MFRPRLLVVLSGPTASGKSDLALSLAASLPFEIVSADSMQVYRGMDIGTAKPSAGERAAVPHHLIDVADPDDDFNAGRFVEAAENAFSEIRARGKVPLVVGGTGMYIRALLRGLDPVPRDDAVRAHLSRRWDEEGGGPLYALLERTDPESARTIHPGDRVRILRALEIHRTTGVPASVRRTAWSAQRQRYDALFLALRFERAALCRRIDARVDRMFESGLIDEVAALIAKGYGPEVHSMKSLGYRHVCRYLMEGTPIPAVREEMKRDTRRYAKRQVTWLSGETGAVWLEGNSAAAAAGELARKHLF